MTGRQRTVETANTDHGCQLSGLEVEELATQFSEILRSEKRKSVPVTPRFQWHDK